MYPILLDLGFYQLRSYGVFVALPWAITFTDARAMAPLGVPLHPIQVYELFAYLVVFLVVRRVSRRAVRSGTVVLTYAVGYGLARFAMEFFRGDPPMVAGRRRDLVAARTRASDPGLTREREIAPVDTLLIRVV